MTLSAAPVARPLPRAGVRRVRRPVLVVAVVLLARLTAAPLSAVAAGWTVTASGSASARAQVLAAPTALSSSETCTSTSPSLVAATTGGMSSGSTSMTVPAATQAGDLLVANIARDGSGLSPPAGWTLMKTYSASFVTAWVWQKVATAGDAGGTVSWTGSATNGGGALVVVRGASGLSQTSEIAGVVTGGNPSTAVAPAVTAGVADSLLVVMDSVQAGGSSTFSVPSGMTSAYAAPATGATVAGFTQAISATGSTGTRTSTIGGATGTAAAASVLVRPGGSSSSSTVALSWTATSATNATGYDVQRDGSVIATVSPRTATTYSDVAPSAGSRTYAVRAVLGAWRSAAVSATVSVACP